MFFLVVLVTLHSSIGNLSKLYQLNLWGCSSLVELPSSIGNLSEVYLLDLRECTSLVTLPSSIGYLRKLCHLDMLKCSSLEFLPADVYLESLKFLDLKGCSQLRKFPRISRNIISLSLEETGLEGEEDSSWIENIPNLIYLVWNDVPLSCMPPNFNPKDLEYLKLSGGRLKKIWEGVKPVEKLWGMYLSGCESLIKIPDLSTAINLEELELKNCKSLVMLHSSVWDLYQLKRLNMEGCTMLEFLLPVETDLNNLKELNLNGCSKLRIFPQISTSIEHLYLDDTGIEEIPSWIKNMTLLRKLTMRRCKSLKNVSAEVFKLERLEADFSDCGGITTICDHLSGPHNFQYLSSVWRMPSFKFHNCFNLDQDAQEIIMQSYRIGMAVIRREEADNVLQLEFCCHEQNSALEQIKGCGARVMDISYTDFRERDEESNRSKKKMRMTIPTFQEHFNSLSIQTAVNSEPMAPNLELSLGLDEASFFDPCLGGESLHYEPMPMIIEQQNTGTSDNEEDPSFSPQLIDFFT